MKHLPLVFRTSNNLEKAFASTSQFYLHDEFLTHIYTTTLTTSPGDPISPYYPLQEEKKVEFSFEPVAKKFVITTKAPLLRGEVRRSRGSVIISE